MFNKLILVLVFVVSVATVACYPEPIKKVSLQSKDYRKDCIASAHKIHTKLIRIYHDLKDQEKNRGMHDQLFKVLKQRANEFNDLIKSISHGKPMLSMKIPAETIEGVKLQCSEDITKKVVDIVKAVKDEFHRIVPKEKL